MRLERRLRRRGGKKADSLDSEAGIVVSEVEAGDSDGRKTPPDPSELHELPEFFLAFKDAPPPFDVVAGEVHSGIPGPRV